MQIGDEIARGATPAGESHGFTNGLIAVTPAKKSGGIGKHKDQECVPGTALLALALDGGDRKVTFDMPQHGPTRVQGDYLATKGLHVDVEHWVETTDYTVSTTFRVEKNAAKGRRALGCVSRQPPVHATVDTDPQVLSEVRQELNQSMEGQALLSVSYTHLTLPTILLV